MDAIRPLAWTLFLATEVLLVAAATAYVGVGTGVFWLVVAAAVVAVVLFAVVVRTTAEPTLGESQAATQRWYWF